MKSLQNYQIMRIIPLLIAVCLVSISAYAQYGGGSGTPEDPYQIATPADLLLLGDSPEDYDKHFILTADVDLDPNLPGRRVFDKAVIGADANDATWWFEGTSFTGVFDGNGHTISHLTVVGRRSAMVLAQSDKSQGFGGRARQIPATRLRMSRRGWHPPLPWRTEACENRTSHISDLDSAPVPIFRSENHASA
jgi:hypothetical protein